MSEEASSPPLNDIFSGVAASLDRTTRSQGWREERGLYFDTAFVIISFLHSFFFFILFFFYFYLLFDDVHTLTNFVFLPAFFIRKWGEGPKRTCSFSLVVSLWPPSPPLAFPARASCRKAKSMPWISIFLMSKAGPLQSLPPQEMDEPASPGGVKWVTTSYTSPAAFVLLVPRLPCLVFTPRLFGGHPWVLLFEAQVKSQ